MNNLSSVEFMNLLDASLNDALGEEYGKLIFLSQSTLVLDGVSVFKIYNKANKLYAVALCSSSVSPNLVMRTMHNGKQVKKLLNASTAKHVIEPLFEGKVKELTYSVLPYCYELSKSRIYRKLQNIFLKPIIFEWVLNITKDSAKSIDQTVTRSSFIQPLQHLASLNYLSNEVRIKALSAIERASTKAWQPKHVVMHGDLWAGNILLRANANIFNTIKPYDNFVITDWAGSEVNGYAIYDLIRIAESLNLRTDKLKVEVEKHCKLLNCDLIDAYSYLLAALGFIALNLEHFPVEKFTRMAESCFSTLSKAIE